MTRCICSTAYNVFESGLKVLTAGLKGNYEQVPNIGISLEELSKLENAICEGEKLNGKVDRLSAFRNPAGGSSGKPKVVRDQSFGHSLKAYSQTKHRRETLERFRGIGQTLMSNERKQILSSKAVERPRNLYLLFLTPRDGRWMDKKIPVLSLPTVPVKIFLKLDESIVFHDADHVEVETACHFGALFNHAGGDIVDVDDGVCISLGIHADVCLIFWAHTGR